MIAHAPVASKPARSKWLNAFTRATAGRVLVYRTPHHGVYHVTSASCPGVEHTVSTMGPRWDELCCTCKAGQHGMICLHQAAAAFARHHHVYAVR